jgi:hypothetical protein
LVALFHTFHKFRGYQEDIDSWSLTLLHNGKTYIIEVPITAISLLHLEYQHGRKTFDMNSWPSWNLPVKHMLPSETSLTFAALDEHVRFFSRRGSNYRKIQADDLDATKSQEPYVFSTVLARGHRLVFSNMLHSSLPPLSLALG